MAITDLVNTTNSSVSPVPETVAVHFTMINTCKLLSVDFSGYTGGNARLYDSLNNLLETAVGFAFSGNTVLIASLSYYIETDAPADNQGSFTPAAGINLTITGITQTGPAFGTGFPVSVTTTLATTGNFFF